MAGVGLANGQFKQRVRGLLHGSKLSIQKLLDAMLLDSILLTNPQPVLTKVVNINLANPLKAHSPWNMSKSNDSDILVLEMI